MTLDLDVSGLANLFSASATDKTLPYCLGWVDVFIHIFLIFNFMSLGLAFPILFVMTVVCSIGQHIISILLILITLSLQHCVYMTT